MKNLYPILIASILLGCSKKEVAPAPIPTTAPGPTATSITLTGRFYYTMPSGFTVPANVSCAVYFTPVVKTNAGTYIYGAKFQAANVTNITATAVEVKLPPLEGYKGQSLSPKITTVYSASSCQPKTNGKSILFWAQGFDASGTYDLGSALDFTVQPDGRMVNTKEGTWTF